MARCMGHLLLTRIGVAVYKICNTAVPKLEHNCGKSWPIRRGVIKWQEFLKLIRGMGSEPWEKIPFMESVEGVISYTVWFHLFAYGFICLRLIGARFPDFGIHVYFDLFQRKGAIALFGVRESGTRDTLLGNGLLLRTHSVIEILVTTQHLCHDCAWVVDAPLRQFASNPSS